MVEPYGAIGNKTTSIGKVTIVNKAVGVGTGKHDVLDLGSEKK